MKEFDENEAVACMRNSLPECDQAKYDDDQLINLIDIIWDFYEQNGLLDIDLDDEDSDDENIIPDLVDYAQRMLKKDKNATIQPDHVQLLVEAEIRYEDSILEDD
jgi:hypothetical protein